ncbi:MAG: M48 family metallopeptidase [Chitinophagales bacterium]
MISPNSIFWLIVAFVIFEFVFSKVVDFINSKSWEQKIPTEVANLYDAKEYEKAKNYAQENGKVGLISAIIGLAFSLGLLFFDGYAFIDNLVHSWTSQPILQTLYFFGVFMLFSTLISLPFSIYKTFVIEEKYGFNKMNAKIFISDFFKSLILGAFIGGVLLAIITWLFLQGGEYFWLYIWLVVAAFSIFITMFYTSLIVPIFNKLKPLEAGSLRSSIETYAEKVGFSLKNIFVIDGSKRSSKSNAYFSGIGAKKAIVLYDTLIEDNTDEELTAILAHEVGHYKKKHVLYGMLISLTQMGVLFFLFGWLAKNENLALALGVKETSFHIALIAFSMLYTPISLITGIFMNMYSRKNEFEADAFAKETYGAEPLISSLKKLSKKHLSNLTPHKFYAFIHFSHPPLVERLKALMK